ncbi:MAG: zinc ABC transporter solute-binding protein, partial [Chloroflexi bacterium]|nr:zinc ABC transporter solute-binding protein [Chloroflexota bacterium]
MKRIKFTLLLALTAVVLMVIGCVTEAGEPGASLPETNDASVTDASAAADAHEDEDEHEAGEAGAEMLILPELPAAELNGGLLRVVATTSIVGDVVAQVGGGEAIDLTILIGPGQDSHSYQPTAQDLTAVASAHVIFINGWDLEEGLVDDLETIGEGVPLVPISANIEPL